MFRTALELVIKLIKAIKSMSQPPKVLCLFNDIFVSIWITTILVSMPALSTELFISLSNYIVQTLRRIFSANITQ